MLVLVLPAIVLLILVGIAASAYLIFRPDPLATVEDKVRTQQRSQPTRVRRGGRRR